VTTDKKAGASVRYIKDDSNYVSTVTGNDGKVYGCVQVGTQIWTNENSAETKYRNGDWITGFDGGNYTPISNVNWAAKTTEAMCFYNDNPALAYTTDTTGYNIVCDTLVMKSDLIAINDTISEHNTRLLAVEGLDTTGIYHVNRALLDAIDATDTTRWATDSQTLTLDSTATTYGITASGSNSRVHFLKSTGTDSQTLSIDSTASTIGITISGGNRVHFDLLSTANVLTLDNTTPFTPDADYEPATKKYVDDNIGGGGVTWVAAPATKTSPGTAGQIARDLNYFYICTATNVWARVALATNW